MIDMQSVEAAITGDVFRVLDINNSVAAKNSFGGTAPDRIEDAIAAARIRYLED